MKKRKWDSNDVRLWCRGWAWHRWGSQRLSPDAEYIDGGKGDYGCDQSRDNVDFVGVPESRRRGGCRAVARLRSQLARLGQVTVVWVQRGANAGHYAQAGLLVARHWCYNP